MASYFESYLSTFSGKIKSLKIKWDATLDWVFDEERHKKCLICDRVIKRDDGPPLQMIICSFDCYLKFQRMQINGDSKSDLYIL